MSRISRGTLVLQRQRVELADVVSIFLASLVVTALATLYPARQAARLFPIEAIRHE